MQYIKHIYNAYKQDRAARWALYSLYAMIVIALLGSLIANEQPLYCKINNQYFFPAVKQIFIQRGWAKPDTLFSNRDWQNYPYQTVIFAPIPYSATTIDNRNADYVSPFDKQQISSQRFRHWLGTDQIGRDVAAGMISGLQQSLAVAGLATLVASLIGIIIGGVAGYFGDNRLRWSWLRIAMYIAAMVWCIYYLITMIQYYQNNGARWLLVGLLVVMVIPVLVVSFLVNSIEKKTFPNTYHVPLDLLLMRIIETFNIIPDILLIVALLATVTHPNVWVVGCIIGLVSWTTRAALIRSEMLRVREMAYIKSTRLLGFSEQYILFRHALPNAIAPVIVAVTYGISAAILAEAALSFLGLGIAIDTITWGKLLDAARDNISAWWLAAFPSLAIIKMVTIFNIIGNRLQKVV